MAYNKIIYGGKTLIDLTADTVTQDKILSGYTAHDMSGAQITGACTFDSDTSSATVQVAEILFGKTAYARGAKIEGSMPNIGKETGTISTKAGTYTIAQGYHDGSGTVGISATEQAKIIASNIREGVTILGVEGSMSASEGEKPQDNKNVTPSASQQVITPDSGFTCLRQVTVAPIPYVETPNAAGGITVTIG